MNKYLAFFTVWILCFSMLMTKISAADTESGSKQKVNDFYLSNLKEDGKRDWEMKGREATIYDKYVDINKMEARYYSNNDVISIKSEKAELNKESMNAKLKENVELKIPDREGGCITINCAGPLEMKYNEGIAIFNNNVVVDNKEGKLFCDKATVFFDAKDRTKLKILAQGHVKIVKDDNIAFCDKAVYQGEQKSVTLEGNPKVIYFSKKNEAAGN
jgi:lipopolysaccharide export system protein LptA